MQPCPIASLVLVALASFGKFDRLYLLFKPWEMKSAHGLGLSLLNSSTAPLSSCCILRLNLSSFRERLSWLHSLDSIRQAGMQTFQSHYLHCSTVFALFAGSFLFSFGLASTWSIVFLTWSYNISPQSKWKCAIVSLAALAFAAVMPFVHLPCLWSTSLRGHFRVCCTAN